MQRADKFSHLSLMFGALLQSYVFLLGDDVDVNYQLGEGSAASLASGNDNGSSVTSSKVDLLNNVITDNLAIQELEGGNNSDDPLKLNLERMHNSGDGDSSNSSKKSKKKEIKKNKRRDSNAKDYKIR